MAQARVTCDVCGYTSDSTCPFHPGRGMRVQGFIMDEAWMIPTEEDIRRLRRASIVDDINAAMRAQDYAQADRLFREYANLLDGETQ